MTTILSDHQRRGKEWGFGGSNREHFSEEYDVVRPTRRFLTEHETSFLGIKFSTVSDGQDDFLCPLTTLKVDSFVLNLKKTFHLIRVSGVLAEGGLGEGRGQSEVKV